MGVVLGRLVEGRADDLALDAPAHVGDFLGALADEGDHQEDVRVVRADAVGDVLEQHRLAGLRRADDQGALALAERVDDVDQPLAEVLGVALEVDQLVRVDRGQVAEDGPAAGGLDVDAVDRVDPEHPPVLLGVARGADGAADAVADPEAEPADLARADVDVVRARQQAVAAHEAEALVDDVEDAGRVGVAGPLGLALEDALDEVVLALLGAGLELELAPDLAELGDAHLAEIGDVEVVPLAGGLELLLLFEFGDRRARRHLGCGGAAAGCAGAGRDRVGAWAGGSSGKGAWDASGLDIARNRSAAQAGLGWMDHTRRRTARQQIRAARRDARARARGVTRRRWPSGSRAARRARRRGRPAPPRRRAAGRPTIGRRGSGPCPARRPGDSRRRRTRAARSRAGTRPSGIRPPRDGARWKPRSSRTGRATDASSSRT